MTPEPQVASPEIMAAATRWAERYARGMTAAEQAEFKAWLASSPGHRRAFTQANGARVDCDWAWPAGVADRVLAGLEDRARRRHRHRMLAGAAAALLVGALGWVWQAKQPLAGSGQPSAASLLVVARPAREVLPDGSVVELKGDARIAADFSARVRAVSLLRGTAYFEVAKEAARPFVVQMGRVAVRAVGTAFALELGGNNEVSLLVTEGRVGVHALRGAEAATAAPLAEAIVSVEAGKTVSLPVAEQLTVVPVVRAVDQAEVRERTSWRIPRLEFSAVPLREVVAQMNQYNSRQLVLGNEAVGAIRVSGTLSADKVDTLTEMLETEFQVRAERRPDKVVLRQ